jgi:hypothetical protein
LTGEMAIGSGPALANTLRSPQNALRPSLRPAPVCPSMVNITAPQAGEAEGFFRVSAARRREIENNRSKRLPPAGGQGPRGQYWAQIVPTRRDNSIFISNSSCRAQMDTVRETRVGRLASRGTAMLNKYVAIGLGALIAFAPLAAVAQTEQLAQAAPAAAPDASMAKPAATHGTRGSHRRHLRRELRAAHHRARESAHHMHKMKTAPAAPAAPKS